MQRKWEEKTKQNIITVVSKATGIAESVKNKAEVNREKQREEDKAKREKRKMDRKVQKEKQIAAMKRKLNEFENAKRKLQ